MTTAKVTSKGQITIPVEVRIALGLETGSRVEFVAHTDGSYEIVPATQSVRDLKGVVRTRRRAVSTERMDEAVADAVVERSRR
jgi:antitoxin PrlF